MSTPASEVPLNKISGLVLLSVKLPVRVPPPNCRYLLSISTVHVPPSFLVPVMTPLPVLNVAPVVYQFTSVSIAKPETSTVLPSDLVSVSICVPDAYVPPVTVTSVKVSNIWTS